MKIRGRERTTSVFLHSDGVCDVPYAEIALNAVLAYNGLYQKFILFSYKENMEKDNKYFWIPVIELAVLAFTTLGTTITLFLHSDSKMEEFRRESLEFRKEWMEETKEFHARLCSIEERNKKI